MCLNCYERFGEPKIVSEKTKAAAQLIAKVFEIHGTGGNLHCQIDDWNLEDEFFDELVEYTPTSDEQRSAERACFNALKAMTLEERASALAIHDGMLGSGA